MKYKPQKYEILELGRKIMLVNINASHSMLHQESLNIRLIESKECVVNTGH